MKKHILILLLGTSIIGGCKKGYLDLNTNPNYPQSVPAASLLAPAEVKTAAIMVDPNIAYANVWMDYWAFSPNYAVSQDLRDYKFTSTFEQGTFTDLYSNAFDYQSMINFSAAQGNPALEGIGRTMKSFLMQYAVDVYNNVPYTQAFKGASTKSPAYDKGQDIYDSIYNDLTLAITEFNSPTAVFPSNTQDIMLGGSKALWIKFANTVKLRILLRQVYRTDRASFISSKLASDFPNGLNSFIQKGEGGIVNPGYTNSDTKQNPFWANFGYNAAGTKAANNDYFKVSAYEVNFYATQNDLRLFYVAKPTTTGTAFFGYKFLGNEMGTQGTGSLTYSDVLDNSAVGGTSVATPYRAPTDPQPVLSDFQSLFLQAEAVQRGWFTGNAQTIFNNAVLQSFTFDFDRVDGAGAGASYVALLTATPDNNWAMATDKIKLIITQKWAALNELNFFEPWIEYKRTGFPAIPLSSSASRGPNIPYRLLYPQTEYDLNGANVGAQGTISQFTSKIWWMP